MGEVVSTIPSMAPCSSYFTSKVKYDDMCWINHLLGSSICLNHLN
ncbi:unnamed protein product [Camellia sinensis]